MSRITSRLSVALISLAFALAAPLSAWASGGNPGGM
jgi:hypothetical protein